MSGNFAAQFRQTGNICRATRQKLPLPGNSCPSRVAGRQIPPERFFRPLAKSIFKQI
jgi:hypothetical protein